MKMFSRLIKTPSVLDVKANFRLNVTIIINAYLSYKRVINHLRNVQFVNRAIIKVK